MTTKPGFNTLCIHAGASPDPATGARATPIYQTVSYVFDDADHAASLFNLQAFGNIYTRLGNPTCNVLEEKIAALEGGSAAVSCASGHAAQLLIFHALLEKGDDFVAARQLYGGSINQFSHSFSRFGWNVHFADCTKPESFRKAITEKTKLIWIESLANPGGVMSDIEPIAKIAHQAGIPLVVDNTLATPYLCRPLEWGADIIAHSATKFIGGQGTTLGGLIVDGGKFDWLAHKDKYPMLGQPSASYHGLVFAETFGNFGLAVAIRALGLRDLGPALAPFNAFLLQSGLETLPLRMERHVENAQKVAQWLQNHPQVEWVKYAGLPSNESYQRAQKYCPNGAGSVMTFGIRGGYDAGIAVINKVELISHVANIGDSRSLIIHSASTTHRQLSSSARELADAGDNVVRLSIGLENIDDIIADLEQALSS